MRTSNLVSSNMAKGGMEHIAGTLMRVATSNMTPKQLLKAARKNHPKASKKEIAQAAFYSIIFRSRSGAGESKKTARLRH